MVFFQQMQKPTPIGVGFLLDVVPPLLRFTSVDMLGFPPAHHRYILWQKYKTPGFEYDKEVDVEYVAEQHELSAASIITILQYSILKCLGENDKIIR